MPNTDNADRASSPTPLWQILKSTLLAVILSSTVARADVLVRISENEYVHDITRIGNQIWLGTDSGVYSIRENDLELVWEGAPIYTITEVGDSTWLGSATGILTIDQAGIVQPLDEPRIPRVAVRKITSFDKSIWLGTDQGLIQIKDSISATPLRSSILDLEIIRNRLWIGAMDNVYVIDSSEADPRPLFDSSPLGVTEIAEAEGFVWLVTYSRLRYGYCYRLDDQENMLRMEALGEVISVSEVEGQAWFGTTEGVYRLENERSPIPILESEPINTIAEIRGQVWMGSIYSAYRQEGESLRRFPDEGRLDVKEIKLLANQIWLRTDSGAYRFDEGVNIQVELSTFSIFGLEILSGRPLGLDSVRYDRSGVDPYDGSVRGSLRAAIALSEEDLHQAKEENIFIPAGVSYQQHLDLGFHKVYIAARDDFGNSTTYPPRVVVVWPDVTLFTPLIIWWTFSLAALCVAPYRRLAMKIVMSSWYRGIASLGIGSIAFYFVGVRKHVLRGYLAQLQASLSVVPEIGEYAPKPSEIADALASDHVALLVGSPDVAENYIHILLKSLLSYQHPFLRGNVPVLIELSYYSRSEDEIERGVQAKLAKIAGIDDSDFVSTLMRRGGFTFILNAVGRLDGVGRVAVSRFIDKFTYGNNVIIVSDRQLMAIKTRLTIENFQAAQRPIATEETSSISEVDTEPDRRLVVRRVMAKNIGPFPLLDLKIASTWNILLGDNGTGKTVLLRAVAAALYAHRLHDHYEGLKGLLMTNEKEGWIKLSTSEGEFRITLSRMGEDVEIGTESPNRAESENYLLIGFPALRAISRDRPKGPSDNLPDGRQSDQDILPLLIGDPDFRMYDLKQWWIDIDWEGSSEAEKLLTDIFLVLGRVMPEMEFQLDKIDRSVSEISVRIGRFVVPIEAVSQGTGSIICWVGTLVRRLYEAYSSLLPDPKKGRALVLLDEIDAHMHPEWQKRIVDSIADIFPNIQFIVTTQSPFVVAGRKASEITLIRKDRNSHDVIAEPAVSDTKGMAVSTILTSYLFGLETQMDLDTEELILERRRLAVKSHLTPAEKERLGELSERLEISLAATALDPMYQRFLEALVRINQEERRQLMPQSADEERRQRDAITSILRRLKSEANQDESDRS